MAESDLTPKIAEVFFEGEGGGYYTWSNTLLPLLGQANVGAGRLVLQPQGFALPHYGDSAKVGYVVQGTDGIVGLILPNTKKEVVLKLQQGDVIPIPLASVSWWYNNGESDLVVVFLGETTKAHVPGQFSYFFLAGALGFLSNFSAELIKKVYNLNNEEVNKLTKSQPGALIIKLKKGSPIPKPQLNLEKEFVYNIDAAKPDVAEKNGGLVTILTDAKFPFVKDVGLSVIRVKLEPGAIKAPSYLTNLAVQLIYVARGGGKIEIVGLNGKRVLDAEVIVGHLLVVPQFFAVAQIAGDEGLESYSIVTTTRPLFEELTGKESIWSAVSPSLLQVAFNVDSKFEHLFISKTKETTNLIPPTN